jgi:methyl-accepting chemotaxis protein
MKAQLPLHRMMQLGFLTVLALLLIVGTTAYRSVMVSSNSAHWVQHTNEVLQHLAHLRSAVETIDSGYRDFALSGDDAFLQLSRGRISLVDQEQSTLRALTADRPAQQRRLVVIGAAVQ